MNTRRLLRLLAACSVLCASPWSGAVAAQNPDSDEAYLAQLSIEELMEIEVVSVSKKGERRWKAAAAVHVITNEDIRRSGATTLMEALRLAPGVQVGRVDSNVWAVSARGFNGRFANKLLVLMDGRSIYTSAFSGVFWDAQDTMLEDVDRIEVIRGPGGTLWGSNAVNGVINIITKEAAETPGTLVAVGGGNEERVSVGLRHGGTLGESGSWRAYAKFFDRDTFAFDAGGDANDEWDAVRAGFRADWAFGTNGRDQATLQGDVYDGTSVQTLPLPLPGPPFALPGRYEQAIEGANLLGRWTHSLQSGGALTLQAYFDRTERDMGFIDLTRDTLDFELQHSVRPLGGHNLTWGFGYRAYDDRFVNSTTGGIDDDPDDLNLWNAFAQDEIRLGTEGRYRLIVGAKLEHNTYTDDEFQPNVRFAYHPSDRTTVWGAVSRAVRIPSRASRDLTINFGVDPTSGGIVRLVANDAVESEELLAYEAGFRLHPAEGLSVDVALFHNEYEDIEASTVGVPFFEPLPTPHLVIPTSLINGGDGTIDGIEVDLELAIAESWRLQAGYTFLDMELQLDPGNPTGGFRDLAEDNPEHQFFVRSSVNFGADIELDATLRYVDELPAVASMTTQRSAVDDYTTLDLRLAWRPTARVELALVGQNLLEDEHLEFIDGQLGSPPTNIERGVYVKATLRF